MNTVERIRHIWDFKPVDRLPLLEWGPWWSETVERWRREGLPATLTDAYAIADYFGLDHFRVLWIQPRNCDTCPKPASHGAGLIASESEYIALKPQLYPHPGFDRRQLEEWAAQQRRGDMALWVWLEGFFWFPRTLLGIERHLYAFYDAPDLMQLINRDLLEYNLAIMRELCAIAVPNILLFAEDLSYNHGPMLSKECFDAAIAPFYRQIVPVLKEYGIHPLMDSDGDIAPIIPWLKEVGIEGLGPLERMAGVDVRRIRAEHPDFLLLGGFDKTVISRGEGAMRAEFERLLPVMRSGGYLPTVDHQTPPEVSLAQYRLYLALMKEYGARLAAEHP